MRKDSHKENACEMVNQGLERHFVHVGKGICRVPSQSKPGTLTFNVDVVHQTCDSFPCCGVRCKHIHFAEMILLKSGTTPARLIEDFSVSVSYFHNEGDSLLTVLANDESDNHSPEVYDIQRKACSCTTASFGLKCVAQYCWEQIHARAQDQPPSIPAEGPQDDPGEPPDDHAADVEVEARPGTSSDQRRGKMLAMIDEIFQWKNSEEFAYRPDIYQNVLELHGKIFSQYQSVTKKRKNESVIKYRPKKKIKGQDHNVYTLEVAKGAIQTKRPVRSHNKDGTFKVKSQNTLVIQKAKRDAQMQANKRKSTNLNQSKLNINKSKPASSN